MKRVAFTFVEVSLCVWVFVFWLTPITLTVLCVSTCSDGLLDFHKDMIPNLSIHISFALYIEVLTRISLYRLNVLVDISSTRLDTALLLLA